MNPLRSLLITVLLITVLAACAPATAQMPTAVFPAGKAYADGKEIYFIHTEASDPDVAQLLTEMMSSPVLYVPSLADVPPELVANVYVFDNGLEGSGPFGYQADVFDYPPNSAGYTPLRRVIVVTWADPTKARLLTSTADISDAMQAGEVTITPTRVVVNMPFVIWDGGKR